MKFENIKGITLISTIIAVIVMVIISGVGFAVFNEDGIIANAIEAEFKNRLISINETVNLNKITQRLAETKVKEENMNYGGLLIVAINNSIINDLEVSEVDTDIKKIISDITKDEETFLVIYKGQLHYVSNINNSNNEKYAQWATEIGIPILAVNHAEVLPPPEEIIPPSDLLNGDYTNVNGVYTNIPTLAKSFDAKKTRYVYITEANALVIGGWLTEAAPVNWYDYGQKVWANILVENNGYASYYTWIPRYCYKLDQTNQSSDVLFIDINNNYKDSNGIERKWEELQAEGYVVPESFTFNGVSLTGFWTSKYTVGENSSLVDYVITKETNNGEKELYIKSILSRYSAQAASYSIDVNNKNIYNSTDLSDLANHEIKLSNLVHGVNLINLTLLNATGEMVASNTMEYNNNENEIETINPPDISEFNQAVTYYVSYDESQNEILTPITEAEPENWYDYSKQQWANIVIKNGEYITYLTWIPRYQYKLNYDYQFSNVLFIYGTSTNTQYGYVIPESFSFNGVELTGFWTTKYTVGE